MVKSTWSISEELYSILLLTTGHKYIVLLARNKFYDYRVLIHSVFSAVAKSEHLNYCTKLIIHALTNAYGGAHRTHQRGKDRKSRGIRRMLHLRGAWGKSQAPRRRSPMARCIGCKSEAPRFVHVCTSYFVLRNPYSVGTIQLKSVG